MSRAFNAPYENEYNQYAAYPMGGIGAGMICLEGTGSLSHFSLWHKPSMYHEPPIYAALCLKGSESNRAILLEGQVPLRKIYRVPGGDEGVEGATYGLPRFERCSFSARFPFGTATLSDPEFPLTAQVTGWSPFIPGNADDSSLPVASLEYAVHNPTGGTAEAVFSFNVPANASGPEGGRGRRRTAREGRGFIVEYEPEPEKQAERGWFAVDTDHRDARVFSRWFRGGWYDAPTMLWKIIESGEAPEAEPYTEGNPTPGSSLFVPLKLAPGETQTIRIRMSWYVPQSALNYTQTDYPAGSCGCGGGACCGQSGYAPWYASRFPNIHGVMGFWAEEYDRLRVETARFTDCFYASTLPPEVMEAVAANLSVLKSPTVLREYTGKLWCWEGCRDSEGCCAGSCTHVWNYAQALPHLFPDLERTMRDVEFNFSQDAAGHQNFRAALPLRDYVHSFHAASDGQLGGVLKVYRDWRISGDTQWLKNLWPKVRQSLEYCIGTWDPDGRGMLTEPHHNTYDIEFWGPDGMCSSVYISALQAAAAMAEAMGEDASRYTRLAAKGCQYLEERLFNGEYFAQEVYRTHQKQIETSGLKDTSVQSEEARALFEAEGPKYQVGAGCLSDGVIGAWMARVCGLRPEILDPAKVRSHLKSLHRYNLKRDLSRHANPQRPGFAVGHEGGLLLCTWPRGGKPSLPFIYSEEVWTGIEYQAASHMILMGLVEEGLEIVRICRSRYDGRVRNPFNEYECGHWYARALSSYSLLQALSGASYDAVDRTMELNPKIKGDFACFIATASGYGLAGVRSGKPFLDVVQGSIPVDHWEYVRA